MPLDGSISALHSVTHRLFGIFGDHSWSAARFYNAFIVSAAASAALGVANLVLLLLHRKQKQCKKEEPFGSSFSYPVCTGGDVFCGRSTTVSPILMPMTCSGMTVLS